MNSAIYVGSVMHRRLRPRVHRFSYRAFWFLLDLDEFDELSRKFRFFSYNRRNFFSFRDSDHGDGSTTPLRTQVEHKLREAGIDLKGGSIRLLCMPRTLGYCFNPLSVYFCRHADGSPAALVYQVHNTFGERHSYVIPANEPGGVERQFCGKEIYVSPFMDMNMRYDFRVAGPGDRVAIGIRATSPDGPILNAVLAGERMAFSDRNLLRVFLTLPAITLKVIMAIHFEALRLWLKGLRIRPRPAPSAYPKTVIASKPALSDRT